MSNHKVIIIVIVAVILLSLSFGAGFLIAKETHPAPIIIEKCSGS